MNRERKHYLESCEVSRLVRYELGGVEQKVTLEGRRADAPVVIFLHGGPGSPLPISVGTRGMFPDLTDRYVLAAWDQLGCGANRCATVGMHPPIFVCSSTLGIFPHTFVQYSLG